jgi:hypothetical protein
MNRFGNNMILYRPVGLQELELIYDSGMKAFPARLPQQPIFYPVLHLEYARQIASDWNAKSGQSAGYVTQFKVEDEYISPFEKHTVGGTQHQEFWIPAEELEEFNRHIVGHIKVVEAYFGDGSQGNFRFSIYAKSYIRFHYETIRDSPIAFVHKGIYNTAGCITLCSIGV